MWNFEPWNKQPLDLIDSVAHLPAAKGLGLEDRDAVNAMKSRLKAMYPKYNDLLKNLTPAVRKQVEVLRGLESEHYELEEKFSEELAMLEAKYHKLYAPLYSQRYHIVNGNVEDEDVKDHDDDTEKGVPNFWLSVMKNNQVTGDLITKRDEAALKYLKDIKWVHLDEPKSFKLEFLFDKNPFFKNSLLTKAFYVTQDELDLVHLDTAIGTTIEWLEGKCLTQKTLKMKSKKGVKIDKLITKTVDCDSFFNFFSPLEIPETEEQLKKMMLQDHHIGSTIKDKIIKHPVSWFTREANQDFRGVAEKLYMLRLSNGGTREEILKTHAAKGPE